jgi:NitT/TauT family transport system substrate-binding protein
MGFWEKHGLDVVIARGSGSVAAAQAIGEGRFDFGMCTPSIAILQTIRGLPTVALAACAYDATMGIGVLNDGPIKTPKDLEGRTMASVATSGDYPFLPLFAEKAGFDLSKVTRIQVDNKVRDRLLPEGKVDAISGFASSAMPSYAATGVNAHFMLFSDYGILNYGTTIMTQPVRIAQEPELCAAFVDGILQGLKATVLDPAEAMKVFFRQVPEMALAGQAREQTRVGTGILIYVAAREIIKTNGMGYMEANDYETMTDLVYEIPRTRGRPAPRNRQPDDQSLCGWGQIVTGGMGSGAEERAGIPSLRQLTQHSKALARSLARRLREFWVEGASHAGRRARAVRRGCRG